jgi:putative transposase
VKGRKRHIVVDTMGLLLVVVVHSCGIQDPVGARDVLSKLIGRFSRLVKIWADAIYRGTLVQWAKEHGWNLEVVERPPGQKGFVTLPRRWVVERTFAWLGLCRRLSKDYEVLPESSEAWVKLAMIGLMLRRLTDESVKWADKKLVKV